MKVVNKGQIAIPKDYSINPGDSLMYLGDQNGMEMVKTELFHRLDSRGRFKNWCIKGSHQPVQTHYIFYSFPKLGGSWPEAKELAGRHVTFSSEKE